MKYEILTVVIVYFALVIAIGVSRIRRTKTIEDFFAAGKGIGLLTLGFATMSAAISGYVFIGGPGIEYKFGLGTLMMTFPASISFAMAWYILGKRIRLLSDVKPVLSVPDMIYHRYQSNLVRALAACAILVGVMGYLGTQLMAVGYILKTLLNTDIAVAVLIGVLIIGIYTVLGGMMASVYVDLFQGIVMTIAAVAVFILVLLVGGGIQNMTSAIAATGESGAKFVGPWGVLPPTVILGWYFVLSIGILGQPHVMHKFYMIKDIRMMRWGPVLAALAAMATGLIWLGVGMVMKYLTITGEIQPLTNPDDVMPSFLTGYAPSLLAGLAFGGAVAASMSTGGAFVNIGAAALMRDIPNAVGKIIPKEKQLFFGRIVSLVLLVFAGIFAMFLGELVAIIGIFGWGAFAAALAPALGIGLNWKRANKYGAAASIVVGIVSQVVLELGAKYQTIVLPSHIYRASIAFILSILTFILVSYLTRAERIDKDVEAVMDL